MAVRRRSRIRRPPQPAGVITEIRATLAAMPADLAPFAHDEERFEDLLLSSSLVHDRWSKLATLGDRRRFLAALRALWWEDRHVPPRPSESREHNAIQRARRQLRDAAALRDLPQYLRGYIMATDARLAKRAEELAQSERIKSARRGRPGRPPGASNATVGVAALALLLKLRPVEILPFVKQFAPDTFDQTWVTSEHLAARIRDGRAHVEVQHVLARLRRLK